MKKLQSQAITFIEMLDKCSDGMYQAHVKANFVDHFPTFLLKETQYKRLSLAGNLFQYPKTTPLTNDTQVIGNLTKRKLVNLYENNLRNKDKPARRFYDELMVSSGERCPFCGDIGHTKNLDHFLPKAHFPEFSIMPLNLVPSCRDCNMGEKGQNYATTEEEQAIHPYVDKDIFFQEQWVFAEFLDRNEGALSYHVSCPATWSQADKDRAHNHFNNLDLASRYRLEAGKHLSEVIVQKNAFRSMILKFDPNATPLAIKNAFIEANLQPLIDSGQFHNHWKKVMYQCLANSDEFL
ncbi:EA31 gene protein [Vibrio ishigakensis]|uniref:EA31 gene protein n=1 Tax=Vibrio ishigakensis TaxID=1481914 RepID=A0A0B8P1Q9_9VIBR|nr:EA31 gene protein [Vibrio ishigakensis]